MEKIKSYIPIIVVVIIAVALVGASAFYMGKANPGKGGQLSSEEASKKVISFINDNILKGQATADLVSILEDNGLYKIKFKIQDQEIESYATMDGKLFFPEAIDMTKISDLVQESGKTIGDFSVSSEPILTEDGKPVVYFFGSESCPHCVWEKPIVEKVMAKFEGKISFHINIDNNQNEDIFKKYSDGGIPVLVLGGKYYRVGSGEQTGEAEEEKNLTALVCVLTGGEPTAVCDSLKDTISQIQQ